MVRTYPDTKDVGAFVLTGVKVSGKKWAKKQDG